MSNSHEIVRFETPLSTLVDGPLGVGQWSFPFTLQLPDWLPASMGYASHGRGSNTILIYYNIFAQFTPIN